ncbi:MAG: S9 family peptidase, partial [Acidimicrobiia bacterium]|nr:S9 family peptidase [Acidimicrobiia bacterium]
TRRDPITEVYFGRSVADPYCWLEQGDSDEVRRWSGDQEELWQSEVARLSGRAHWISRLRQLLGAGYRSSPTWRGAREFFMRRSAGEELGILYTRKDPASEIEVLIDPLEINPGGTTTLDSWQPSKEGDQLAYQLSTGGTEESTLYVLDVETHEVIDGPIDRARYSPIAWLPGGKAFYYVRRLAPELLKEDERQYHRRVYFHIVGSDPTEDVEIFGSGLEMTNYYGVSVSMDGRWLTLSASAGTEPRNDLWLADLHASSPTAPKFILIQSAESDAQTSLEPLRDGRILISTNFDAPRGRICISSPTTLLSVGESAEWRDLVPEDPEAVISGWGVLDGPLMPASMLLVLWS